MSDSASVDTLLERLARGELPVNVRAAAARGALPLPRADVARVQVHLLDDPEEAIKKEAAANLAAMDPASIVEILGDRSCAPEVLQHFAQSALHDEKIAERVIFHAATPDASLMLLAAKGNSAVAELLLTNQERLLAESQLLNCLTLNASLSANQRGRIVELLERLARKMTAGARPAAADPAPAGPTEEERARSEEMARVLELDVGDLVSASEISGGEEFANSDDDGLRNAYTKILGMNPAQKAILAIKGAREERMILIRDTNRIVAMSVLKNQRISDGEVEQIAMMRNVTDDVLRSISQTREWMKHYSVLTALVRNPRTPPGVASNFIPRLLNRDLKNLGKDRNVPEFIRRMARRTLEQRTQKKTVNFRKGK